MARQVTITFDANDVSTLVDFWQVAMGYEKPGPPDGYDSWADFAEKTGVPEDQRDAIGAIIDPAGVGPRLLFLKVPEGKTAKNRVHLDVHTDRELPDDERAAAQDSLADELVTAGATMVGRCSDFNSSWIVLADPEGNEFCVV